MLVDRISVHLFDLGPLPTVWFAVQGPIYVAAKRAVTDPGGILSAGRPLAERN